VPAIGFGILWSGYTLLFWGWTRIKGYDIGLADIVMPKHYKGKWPPPIVDDSGKSGLGGPGGNGVKPGDHPGDMPWTYPANPNDRSASDPGSGSSSSGGGVIQA
jgi:hypothetical protein